MERRALIIGATRGLGLAITQELLKRNWSVTATRRGDHPINATGRLDVEDLDITSAAQIAALKSRLGERRFDLVFVSAGVANTGGMSETAGQISTDEFNRVMLTNALSPLRLAEQLIANLSDEGMLGIMSSGQGSIADNEAGGNDVYRASKAALNMMMRSFSARHPQRAMVLLAPGWIKTDMGGSGAKFTIEETITDIVNTITARPSSPGLRFVDRFNKPVRW